VEDVYKRDPSFQGTQDDSTLNARCHSEGPSPEESLSSALPFRAPPVPDQREGWQVCRGISGFVGNWLFSVQYSILGLVRHKRKEWCYVRD
jgi:hypothetical protein